MSLDVVIENSKIKIKQGKEDIQIKADVVLGSEKVSLVYKKIIGSESVDMRYGRLSCWMHTEGDSIKYIDVPATGINDCKRTAEEKAAYEWGIAKGDIKTSHQRAEKIKPLWSAIYSKLMQMPIVLTSLRRYEYKLRKRLEKTDKSLKESELVSEARLAGLKRIYKNKPDPLDKLMVLAGK